VTSNLPEQQGDDEPSSEPELLHIASLITEKCGVAKTTGDWHQRICSLREVCEYIDRTWSCEDDSFDCVQAMRELEHSLSRLALLPNAPGNRGKTSGSARSKFATIRDAVGEFIGSDILRALIDLAEPNTCHNIRHLSRAINGSVLVAVEAAVRAAQAAA